MFAKIKKALTIVLCKIVRGILIGGMLVLFRPKVTYIDKQKDKEARKSAHIIIGNHTSLFDGIMIATVMRRHKNIYLLVTNKWYKKPLYKIIFAGNRCIPVDLETMDTAWMHESMKAVRGGSSICIFPEGHRSRKGTLDDFKPGFTLLAKMTGVPIIPVSFSGPYKYVFGPRKQVLVGVPTPITESGNDMSAEFLSVEADRFRTIMLEMAEHAKTGTYKEQNADSKIRSKGEKENG